MENMIPEIDEAELKVATTVMFKHGGVQNVLNCVLAMQKVQGIILAKLQEIMDAQEPL